MEEIKPVRIQRSRQHKMVSPNGLPIVYVGRPTAWGNPFEVGRLSMVRGYSGENSQANFIMSPVIAVELFKLHVEDMGWRYQNIIKEGLKGKNLACWCPLDRPCHADILLEAANHE